MEEYASNAHNRPEVTKAKESTEREKVEPVAAGKTRKKDGAHKLADVFISDDISNIKSYIVMDVLVPTIKKAVSDIVKTGIDMILYNGDAPERKRSGSGASKISYQSYYDRDRRSEPVRGSRSIYDYDDIILDTRGEAEEVLSRLDELIDRYRSASVADLYDLVGVTGKYTDNKYGWDDIRSARVDRVRDGYILKLPRAIPLD